MQVQKKARTLKQNIIDNSRAAMIARQEEQQEEDARKLPPPIVALPKGPERPRPPPSEVRNATGRKPLRTRRDKKPVPHAQLVMDSNPQEKNAEERSYSSAEDSGEEYVPRRGGSRSGRKQRKNNESSNGNIDSQKRQPIPARYVAALADMMSAAVDLSLKSARRTEADVLRPARYRTARLARGQEGSYQDIHHEKNDAQEEPPIPRHVT